MKLRYIITALACTAALVAGCKKEVSKVVDLSCSYVTFLPEGGKVNVQLSAHAPWSIDTTGIKWVNVTPASGLAGEYTLVFTADTTKATNSVDLNLYCAEATQIIKVLQQTEKQDLPITPVKDIKAGATYRAKGVATGLYSPQYGNFYLNDGTGSILVYGLLDQKGQAKNYPFESWNLEAGDVIEIEGYVKDYNGTLEFVEVAVVGSCVTKSLLKLVPENMSLGKQDTSIVVKVVYKGENLDVNSNADWIKFDGIKLQSDTTLVMFSIEGNEGGPRTGTVSFASALNGQESTGDFTISQEGGTIAISDIVIGEPAFVSGQISGMCTRALIITDATGSVVYYNAALPADTYKIGDKVEIMCTKVTSYNGAVQLDASNVSKFNVVETGEYTYPAPKIMSVPEINAYLSAARDTTALYVSIIGKAAISGNYYNVVLDGTDKQGSIYYADAATKAKFESGKSYEITGYLIGYSKKSNAPYYANIVVVDAKELNPTKTFAEIITAGAGSYSSKDVMVMAVGGTNVVLSDGTGFLFAYNKDKNAKVGQKVTLNGSVEKYKGCWEWNNPTIYVNAENQEVVHPAPVEMNSTVFDAYKTNPAVSYFKAAGTYGNKLLEGTGFKLNLYSNETLTDGALTCYGYGIGYDDRVGKEYINFVYTSKE